MRIRAATVDDAEAVATIHVRSWQEAYRGIIADDVLDGLDVAQRTERWRENLGGGDVPAGGVLVAEDPDVVAFATIGPARDQQAGEAVGEVWAIYAHPRRWGTGVGRALMTAALDGLQQFGFTSAVLWVLADNHRARRFYEATGWHADGAVDRFEIGEQSLEEVRYARALP